MSKLTNYLKNKHSEYGDLKFNDIYSSGIYARKEHSIYNIYKLFTKLLLLAEQLPF